MSCNWKKLITSSRHSRFSKFCPQKVTGCKGKNQVTFFMVSFKINLFSKISYMHWLFWAIYQTKKTYRTIFTAGFLYTFSIKMFLIKYSIKRPSFNIWGEWPSQLFGWPTTNFPKERLLSTIVIIAFSTIST